MALATIDAMWGHCVVGVQSIKADGCIHRCTCVRRRFGWFIKRETETANLEFAVI